jgi:hypothetical protein
MKEREYLAIQLMIDQRRIRAIETDRDKQNASPADNRGQNDGADETPEEVPLNTNQRCGNEQEERKVDPDRPGQKRNRPLKSVVNDQPGLRLRLNDFMDPESNNDERRRNQESQPNDLPPQSALARGPREYFSPWLSIPTLASRDL